MPSIIAAIEQQERLASNSGALAEERERAIDLYLGRPYGDEQDGRSKVVMRDVADTIEWIKPSLVKVFCSGDEVAKFSPVGFEDEKQAEQETDYINHVIQQKNDGFTIFYDWFHDALLQKNGYVWVQYCEEKQSARSKYKGLTDNEFAMLMQGDDRELLEHTEYLEDDQTYHDCVIRRSKTYKYPKISNVPGERVLVASDWPSLNLQGCPFVEIIDFKTISDLRNEGYDVPDDINDTAQYSDDEHESQHRKIDSQEYQDPRQQEADPSTRRVKVRYVYMNWDGDKDGIAELRHIVIVGTTPLNGPDGEEDDITPVACISPVRMPHEHNGLSITDIVEDLQRIRTVLVRGMLDNMYLANNGQYAIDETRVNLDDMLTARPGGIKRVQGDPNLAILPLVHPQVGGDVLQAVEYIDSVRENRTGVTRYNQGMDANSLNKTASGINNIMNAAAQRIELIARLFAETGVKHLMLIVHAVTLKNSSQVEKFKLRNEWVPIDPRAWSTRRDMTVSVGLGNGNKDQMVQQLMLVGQMQAQGVAIGIATAKNIYNTGKRFTQAIGFKNAEEFWTDPEQATPQEPKKDPLVQAEEVKAGVKREELQFKAQQDAQRFQADTTVKAQEASQRLAFEADQKERDRQLELRKAEIAAQTQITIAQIRETNAMQSEGERVMGEVQGALEAPIRETGDMTMAALQQVAQMLQELIGSQPVGFERGADGRVAGIRRRNGNVSNVVLDEQGRISGVQ